MIGLRRFLVPLAAAGLAAASATAGQQGGSKMSMKISSRAFDAGGEIPTRHTCEGPDLSPPLSFTGVPPQAKSLVLIVDDPDAPDPARPKMTWVHWVIYNMPPSTDGLAEGVSRLPEGAVSGMTDFGRTGWGGPCPPIGRHRYFFKLYALDTTLPDIGPATKSAVMRAMEGHVVASAELMGTYQKKSR